METVWINDGQIQTAVHFERFLVEKDNEKKDFIERKIEGNEKILLVEKIRRDCALE